MSQLKINNLSFKYSHINIFSNLNLSFSLNWSSLVGNNGSGKTTLLKLISKKLIPEQGSITGNDLVYYCNQNLEETPEGFDEFIYTFNTKTFKIKQLLNIDEEWFFKWSSLSYGERKRIQIAIALNCETDILLLDEPTNHLDYDSKKIVLNALKSYKGIGIIVSHDREVLNSLCTNTNIIKGESIYTYKSNYDEAIKQINQHSNFLIKENENINSQLKKIQKNIEIQKEKVSLSKTRLSKKNIDKKDKDLKEKINLAKLTGKDKHDSKLISSFSKKHKELTLKRNTIEKEFNKGVKIQSDITKKGLFSIYLKEGSIKLDEKKVLYYPDVFINEGEKIAIMGNNGVGKSSFLNLLISKIEIENKYLYLPQEIEKTIIKELYDDISNFDNEKKGLLFTLIRRLSSNPKALLDNKHPSSGEIRKLFISKALLENIDLIILDEPTNHMDIDSIEAIEKALINYNKTLIVVSHDITFIKNLRAKVFLIKKENNIIFRLNI